MTLVDIVSYTGIDMPRPKVLTPEEISQIMKVNIMTIYRWIKAGKLKASKITRRTYRILEKDFNNFLKKYRK